MILLIKVRNRKEKQEEFKPSGFNKIANFYLTEMQLPNKRKNFFKPDNFYFVQNKPLAGIGGDNGLIASMVRWSFRLHSRK